MIFVDICICPCCEGSGEVVVDIRRVPDTYWEPGWDEEICAPCDECGGSGYAEQEPEPLSLNDLEERCNG